MCLYNNWLVVSNPLKNMSSSIGMIIIPIFLEKYKSHVPNHQPDNHTGATEAGGSVAHDVIIFDLAERNGAGSSGIEAMVAVEIKMVCCM